MDLKKQISESEFEMRNMENQLREDLKVLKESSKQWGSLGLLDEKQIELINQLQVEDIKSGNFENFINLYEQMKKITEGLDSQIETLEKQLRQVNAL